MSSNGANGRGTAERDPPSGQFAIPAWLQEIKSGKEPINTPAEGKWTFQLHPYGQILWQRSWQTLNWLIWGGVFICLVGLLLDILSSSATLIDANSGFPALKNLLFDIVLTVVFIALGIVLFRHAKGIKKRIILHRQPAKDPKPKKDAERFFVRVNFHTGAIDYAIEFADNEWGWPKPKWVNSANEINVHPSTVQNTLPRLYHLQEIGGRIKLRFDQPEHPESRTYIFESCRWLCRDRLSMVLGFVPAITTLALSVNALASPQSNLLGFAASAWIGLAVLLLALGIALSLYLNWQRWKTSLAGVAVVFAQAGEGHTATVAWNQYLGLSKGFQFHSVAVLLEEVGALKAFCTHLSELHEMGELFKLSKET